MTTRLPSCWRVKIVQLCEDFDETALPTVNGVNYLHYVQDSLQDAIIYLFPPIILWSPLEQFQDLVQAPLSCPKCASLEQNDVSLHPTGWCNCAQETHEKYMVLMVSLYLLDVYTELMLERT